MENSIISGLSAHHHENLYNHALRLTNDTDDAKELVQDTMLKALRFYNNFQEGTNLIGWLYVIMKNNFINNYRRRTATQKLILQTDRQDFKNIYNGFVDNSATAKFIIADVHTALAQIPEDYAAVFKRFFEGYKYWEIAQEFSMPIGTVKTRIHKARALLRNNLRQYRNFAG